MICCYISLGSNLDDPRQHIRSAIRALQHLPDSNLTKLSRFYWSRAIGPDGQGDYLNGAAQLVTTLEAEALLDQLQIIEASQGRKRGERWGARTLDLDLLLYGNTMINSARLTVPHPELLNRDFVLRPLLDIDPDLCLMDGTKLASRLDYCPNNHLRAVDDYLLDESF
jgi:2-amino-4-hydroxy-6-hydroxymethyldihydropteridine diphosphokinase